MAMQGVKQRFSNFIPGDLNFRIKILRDPNQKQNVNLPKLVRGVSLFSFTEFIKMWHYFGYLSAYHRKARNSNFRPSQPIFGLIV